MYWNVPLKNAERVDYHESDHPKNAAGVNYVTSKLESPPIGYVISITSFNHCYSILTSDDENHQKNVRSSMNAKVEIKSFFFRRKTTEMKLRLFIAT